MKIKYSKITLLLFCALTFCVSSCQSDKQKNQIVLDPPTSKALPEGMKLVWHDEFNTNRLDSTKWFTNYYSILDYVYETNFEDFRADRLPQPHMEFTDSSIILIVDENLPERPFWENGRKISSIQTYDWNSNKNKLDNSLGGYFEARIKRNATDSAKNVNIAFWFDSPGPDPRYFVEKGNKALGVEGIRPRGQVFEIDLCEYITTEIVLHGNVSPTGEFERNIGHYIHPGEFRDRWVTHGMLWTPAGLKFYIDGELVKEWWDPNDIKSPNHEMNMFFGAYGNDGTVTMEVDYVRYYQWTLNGNNELPNGDFEYNGVLFPWEGNASIDSVNVKSGKYAATLQPNDSISQPVYLEHSQSYALNYSAKGKGNLSVAVQNITQVSGKAENDFSTQEELTDKFSDYHILFKTNPEYGDHKRTVKVSFVNTGNTPITIDAVKLVKSK